ncbi:MAG: flavin reductase [Oscillospiraceae bacterium]|nr:flavin reductase [Oscillospiraceae bacterium]
MDPKVMFNITYGLYLLTARQMGKDNGCIINSVMQVAENPVRIAVSVLKGSLTHDMIAATGVFNVSAITTGADFALFQRFGMQSGRTVDKFADFPHAARSENTIYRLRQNANMFLSAVVTQQIDLGTHTLFIAEVVDGEILSNEPGCTYGYYQSDIKPKAKKTSSIKQWECKICGFVYEGDEVPDDYECPLCLHGKDAFVLIA